MEGFEYELPFKTIGLDLPLSKLTMRSGFSFYVLETEGISHRKAPADQMPNTGE